METNYEAHRKDETGLLNILHNFWWGRHTEQQSPRDNYAAYLKCHVKSQNREIVGVILLFVGFVSMILCTKILSENTPGTKWKYALLICLSLIITLSGAVFCLYAGKNEVSTPEIWNAYEHDLQRLLEEYPFLETDEQIRNSEDIVREIGRDTSRRAAQIAAKQGRGDVVDAYFERVILEDKHSFALLKFGIVKPLSEYFPKSTKA